MIARRARFEVRKPDQSFMDHLGRMVIQQNVVRWNSAQLVDGGAAPPLKETRNWDSRKKRWGRERGYIALKTRKGARPVRDLQFTLALRFSLAVLEHSDGRVAVGPGDPFNMMKLAINNVRARQWGTNESDRSELAIELSKARLVTVKAA